MAKKNGVKAIACEMCGSNDVVKQDGMYVCQFCGTKYSVEEARKLMVEGTVKIDGPVEVKGSMTLEKMVQNGETFLKLEKMDDALRVFTEITEKYPEDYRGWWGKAKVYSNNLRSSSADSSIVKENEIHNDDISRKKDYVTNDSFYDAWQTALTVASKGDVYNEVESKGEAYLNSHRKHNCQKIIDGILKEEGCQSLNGLKIAKEIMYKKIKQLKIFFLVRTVVGVVLLIAAIVILITRIINESDWEYIWLVLIFVILAFIALSMINSERYKIMDAENTYNRKTHQANTIEFHQNNLKRM